MRVLGIDPGSAVTGYGLIETNGGGGARLVECGVIRTSARDPLLQRLRAIHEDVGQLIRRHLPDVVAVEEAFHSRNARTTLVLGQARGVILLAAAQADLVVAEYAPRLIKQSVTGKGGALKPQVAYMVARLLHLQSAPTPADAADGVAVALTHLLRSRSRALHRPVAR
jgi:crossover junction endodeoxyribonuclease RuvC